MQQIFSLTLVNVIKMLIFIGIGYTLSHTGRFPKDTSRVLSAITTMLFYPAYSIKNFSQNFTLENPDSWLRTFVSVGGGGAGIFAGQGILPGSH